MAGVEPEFVRTGVLRSGEVCLALPSETNGALRGAVGPPVRTNSGSAPAGAARRRSFRYCANSFNFTRNLASMSAVIEARSYSGAQPHSSRAAESSSAAGQESAIACRTGSTS